jgi:hypothetical protein
VSARNALNLVFVMLCIANMMIDVYDMVMTLRIDRETRRRSGLFVRTWKLVFGPAYTITAFLCAAMSLAMHDYLNTALFSLWALLGAWTWWHDEDQRRRRKKLREKLAAKVVDLGGKLKVVPGGAS